MLKTRCQRTILHLDAEKFEMLFVIRARQAIGAEQRLAIDFEADHGELAVFETERGIARASEAEQRVCPVMDA